jgi:hypothetical protein
MLIRICTARCKYDFTSEEKTLSDKYMRHMKNPYKEILLSSKSKNNINTLFEMPIKWRFGFVFEKVSLLAKN